jgi:TPR repeat protein
MCRSLSFLVSLAAAFGLLCPACGQSPDVPAPRSGADAAGRGDTDAPNGVCRVGAELVDHVGCVDEELAYSPDAIDRCRATGEAACDARCQQGDPASCTALALVHELALEATPNRTYAARLLDRACAAGDGTACNDLGVLHAKGIGFPVEVERGETLYAVACEHGSVTGCANYVMSRRWGSTGVPAPVVRAAGVVEGACTSARDARACAALGVMRARGSVLARDERLAAALLDRACKLGDMAACAQLGKAYLVGDGVAPDDAIAVRLFRRACDRARSDACTDLATMYCLGRGIPRDAGRSTALFRQACVAGDAAACRANLCGG